MEGDRLPDLSDEELVGRIVRGEDRDRCAEVLVERRQPMLRRSIRRRVRNDDDADDLCQLTWARAYRSLASFDAGKSTFPTWLCTIGLRLAQNLARNRGREAEALDEYANELCTTCDGPEEEYRRKALKHELWTYIHRLPFRQRSPLVRHYIDGRTYAEMSRTFGESKRKLSYHAHAGLAALRRMWTEGET